jgi:Holliday junction resolvase-like predicted endonuclease
MGFEEVKIKSEVTELEQLVIAHMDAVEPRLIYLDHQSKTEGGRLDVLCLDQDGILVVIELKNREDDTMLLQALEYLDYVNENKDRLASFYAKRLKQEKKDIEIDKTSPPRIILISPSFSDTLKKSVKYIDEDYQISLKQFKYLRSKKTGETAPYFPEVPVEGRALFEEPKTVDDHINKIADTALRQLSHEIIEKIRSFDPAVELRPAQYWLGFFYRGRRFGILESRKSKFHLYVTTAGAKTWDEFPMVTVEKREDLTSDFLEKMRQRCIEVGGQSGQ